MFDSRKTKRTFQIFNCRKKSRNFTQFRPRFNFMNIIKSLNRINIEVLSVVAQQILSILTALSQKVVRFVFEGYEIKLVHTCGIFITMNPGYAGRTELPDNLKSMFRPISMMVPDSNMIAEINLFCEGFEGTRILARKVSISLLPLALHSFSHRSFHPLLLRFSPCTS